MFDSQTHHHTTVPPDVINRIEKQMCEAAASTARNVAEQVVAKSEMRNRVVGDTAVNRTFAESGASALPKPTTPRLEPFHGEVKLRMKSANMTEKEAEKAVRKELLHDAAFVIPDKNVQALVHAVLSLI